MIPCAFAVESVAFTHQGNVRDHNEDACADLGERGLWVVADGMGGHDHGDYASQKIVEHLRNFPVLSKLSEIADLIEDRLTEVNEHLYARSQEGPQPSVIGSTVVVLTVFDRYGLIVWAGDSRAYRFSNSELERVSRDHSEVQTLIEQGLVHPDEAESHPQANVITRAVGGAADLFLDYELRELRPGDRYLLCSDGLYKELTDFEVAERLSQGSCQEAAMGLLNAALSRQCSDNVSVLVVDITDTAPEGEAAPVAD